MAGQSHLELRSTQLPRHTREGGYPGGEQWGNRPLDTRLRGYDDNWDEASVSNTIALLPALVHRAAIAGLSKIDPYITSLHLLQDHVADGNFSEADALIKEVKAAVPPTPHSEMRARLENLQGIISLFQHDLSQAENCISRFHRRNTSRSREVRL
jgi:hypothetical protein